MLLFIAQIVGGLAGLFFGGRLFVNSADIIARSLGISALVIGLTVVAIGTSMPELLVSVNAALTNNSDITIGNVVGSNIANIGLIIGIAALIRPFGVERRVIRREIPILVVVSLLMFAMVLDGDIQRFEGAALVGATVAYLTFTIISARQEMAEADANGDHAEPIEVNRAVEAGKLLVGLVILLIGARLTVDGATGIARALEIPEIVIGITLVALGTSLPELVTTVVASLNDDSDLVMGNVVGSNVMNILLILGLTALIQPISVVDSAITFDAPVMIGFTLLLVPFALDRSITRVEGTVFIVLYVVYIGWLFIG